MACTEGVTLTSRQALALSQLSRQSSSCRLLAALARVGAGALALEYLNAAAVHDGLAGCEAELRHPVAPLSQAEARECRLALAHHELVLGKARRAEILAWRRIHRLVQRARRQVRHAR